MKIKAKQPLYCVGVGKLGIGQTGDCANGEALVKLGVATSQEAPKKQDEPVEEEKEVRTPKKSKKK